MSNQSKKAEDNINSFTIAIIGLVSALMVWCAVVALQAYYANTNDELENEREYVGQATDARSIRAAQEAQLEANPLETVDAKRGLVRVPITYAMSTVIKDLGHDPSAMVVPAYGSSNKAMVPAVWGRPPDDAKPPVREEAAAPATDAAGSADGAGAVEAPAGATGTGEGAAGAIEARARGAQPAAAHEAQAQPAHGARAPGQAGQRGGRAPQ